MVIVVVDWEEDEVSPLAGRVEVLSWVILNVDEVCWDKQVWMCAL